MAGSDNNTLDDYINQQLSAAAASGGPAGDSSSQPVARVYMGRSAGSTRFAGKEMPGGERLPAPADQITSVDDASLEFHRMSPKAQKKWADQLIRAGIIEPGNYTYDDLNSLWQDAVSKASEIFEATGGHKKITPQQYVALNATTSGSAANKAKRTTQTQTQTSFSTKLDARGILTQELQSALGRDPSQKELGAFYRALHKAQGNHPSTATSVTKNNAAGTKSSTSTTSSGGLDTGAFAQGYVDDTFNHERDDRAAATEYYDALLGLTGGG